MMRRFFCLAVLLGCVLDATLGFAQVGMRVLPAERLRIDGRLNDWRGAEFASVGSGTDHAFAFLLAYDAEALYVAANIADERLVRTPERGLNEDALVLTLAMPGRRGRWQVQELYFFAGVEGDSEASVGLARPGASPARVREAQVVEGRRRGGNGYTIEARVPWRAIRGSQHWQEARASIRLRDVDSEARPRVEAEPALVAFDPRHPERLLRLRVRTPESAALEAFLSSQQLVGTEPRYRFEGDVMGASSPEHVLLVDRYVVVLGRELGGGYRFRRLDVSGAQDIRRAELRDLTGDGKAELLLVLRSRRGESVLERWAVLSLSGESPELRFEVELSDSSAQGVIEAALRIAPARARRLPTIVVRAARSSTRDADSFRPSPNSNPLLSPLMLPWGPDLERSYRWDGQRFSLVEQRPNPRYRDPAATPSREETPAPAPGPVDETPSEARLLAAFREAQGIPASQRARFRIQGNLIGGRGIERGWVFGRQLVLIGRDIQEGRSWMFFQAPVNDASDLLRVEAADVTGDRRAEILFTVRQTIGEVRRELLLVHQVQATAFPTLLTVEIARQQAENEVRNQLVTRGGRLQIRPGRARGFSASYWPFSEGVNDGVEPLLLPWRDQARRYRLQNGQLR